MIIPTFRKEYTVTECNNIYIYISCIHTIDRCVQDAKEKEEEVWKRDGKGKKKGKNAPKVYVGEFDTTPCINVNTGELPLPLDAAARIATGNV
jgi:hypothetical protein